LPGGHGGDATIDAFVSWLCAGRVKGLYNYFTGFTMPNMPLLHELFAGGFKELDKDSCAH